MRRSSPDDGARELVALVDATGRPAGTATRPRMRELRLLHAATAVFVRDGRGRLYVHRRSPDKDWAPSRHDACAGGVLLAGEEPAAGARRELAEELGVEGAELEPLGSSLYEGPDSRAYEFVFQTRWDGPVRFADGEAVWGAWLAPAELRRRLDDPGWPFVPDTRLLLRRLAARGLPGYEAFGEPGAER